MAKNLKKAILRIANGEIFCQKISRSLAHYPTGKAFILMQFSKIKNLLEAIFFRLRGCFDPILDLTFNPDHH